MDYAWAETSQRTLGQRSMVILTWKSVVLSRNGGEKLTEPSITLFTLAMSRKVYLIETLIFISIMLKFLKFFMCFLIIPQFFK